MGICKYLPDGILEISSTTYSLINLFKKIRMQKPTFEVFWGQTYPNELFSPTAEMLIWCKFGFQVQKNKTLLIYFAFEILTF